MPTFETPEQFIAEYLRMPPAMRRAFLAARSQFVEDLKANRQPRPSLRVKRVAAHPGIWEMTWAPDGRATFEYGDEVIPGQPHIIWRRIGSHEIFRRP